MRWVLSVTALVCLGPVSLGVASDWPMWRHDAARSGATTRRPAGSVGGFLVARLARQSRGLGRGPTDSVRRHPRADCRRARL